MVCLAVATMILTSMLSAAASQRRVVKTQRWQAQAGWLAESGLERAAARLAANGNYPGETWTLPAQQLGSPDSAVVRIEVQSVSNQPNRRLVRATADYPDHPHDRARQTRQATVQLRTAGEEP
jgi:type II secretory pathway component PulK